MTTIDASVFMGLLGLPRADIEELVDIVSAVCCVGQMSVNDKLSLSMRLMNSGVKLFESVGGSSYISNLHPTFPAPIEYCTGDTDSLGGSRGA